MQGPGTKLFYSLLEGTVAMGTGGSAQPPGGRVGAGQGLEGHTEAYLWGGGIAFYYAGCRSVALKKNDSRERKDN